MPREITGRIVQIAWRTPSVYINLYGGSQETKRELTGIYRMSRIRALRHPEYPVHPCFPHSAGSCIPGFIINVAFNNWNANELDGFSERWAWRHGVAQERIAHVRKDNAVHLAQITFEGDGINMSLIRRIQ